MTLTDEQRQMARTLNFDPENPSKFQVEIIDEMIHLRATKGEERFHAECAARFQPPPPTLRDVMKKLDCIERAVKALERK